MNYRFKNLLGAPYRGGNAILSNNTNLLSAVGNRVSVIDLIKSESLTLPCENAKNISRIAVSPDGTLLVSVDEDGRCVLINLRRRVLLHRISFKKVVSAIKFSHNGALLAVAVGRLVQVWRTPGFRKEFAPFELLRTFSAFHDRVTCLDWSPDGQWIIAGSKDLTARLLCLRKIDGYRPIALLGHRHVIVGVFFTLEKTGRGAGRVNGAYTIAKDGVICSWRFHLTEEDADPEVSLDDKSKLESKQDADQNAISENAETLIPTEIHSPPNTVDSIEAAESAEILNPAGALNPADSLNSLGKLSGHDKKRSSEDEGLADSRENRALNSSEKSSENVKKHRKKREGSEDENRVDSGENHTPKSSGKSSGNDKKNKKKREGIEDENHIESWENDTLNSSGKSSGNEKRNKKKRKTSKDETQVDSVENRNLNSIVELSANDKKNKRNSSEDDTYVNSGENHNGDNGKDTVRKTDSDGCISKDLCQETLFPLHKGRWKLLKKDFFGQTAATLTACDYHSGLDLVVVGFSSGIFGLYQMPDFTCIHLLSISRQKISTAVFNNLGNWLAFGCAKLGQLLVWEWRSETYVLKQQGHYFDVNCVSYSPDSQLLATGADDCKVKVWTASSGFCFVTFAEHTNAVTAVHFLPGNHALLSASLDGTVRAWDLFRYRNFRTFTTPSAKQFVSLAADQSGEVICAGTLDSFEIFVWSMKTGRLLDVLSGHEGPVHGLIFSPTHPILSSSSWDKTVRLWDVFEGKGAVEKFSHTHDVLTVVYRPDGKQLACSTLDGQIHFWDPIEGQIMWTIEGRRDIAGGRLMGDRRTAANSSSGKCFTCLCYSADGSYIIAGGTSKYICMYDVAEQVLLRRFQITGNLSLDGVLDFLNSKNMTDAGPLGLIDDEDSDLEGEVDRQTRGQLGYGLPGTAANHGRPVARTKCLEISPTGRSWAAATTEGVLIYSMDDSVVFDPTDLDIDVTPEAVDAALSQDQHLRALVLALRLNEASLVRKCVLCVHPKDVATVVASVPSSYLRRLIEAFAEYLESSPHLEFLLQWCQELLKSHGQSIQQHCKDLLPALRSLQKALTRLHQDLADTCSANEYLLQYLCIPSFHH